MKRYPLRHGDRVAYAAGPTVRRLELVKLTVGPRRYDLGTVVVETDPRRHGKRHAIVIWDDAEVYVDDVVASTGLLWGDDRYGRPDGRGVAYAVVTPESRCTSRDTRRMRAAVAKRRLDLYCARGTERSGRG